MLEREGRAVGVTLLIVADPSPDGESRPRCNLSSWYVDPDVRPHASSLARAALRLKGMTYVNVSPAPHTLATIRAQGFRPYASGVFVGVPSLKGGVPGARVHRVFARRPDAAILALPERKILLDHVALGCLSLVVEAADGLHPFVFLPFRLRSGQVRPPIRQLIYCRATADYVHFAGPFGRHLLWRGSPFVLHDANGPEPALLGRFFVGVGAKYASGPAPPRLGDLAYTERVIFGP